VKVLNFGSLNIDYVYNVDHFVRPGETLHSNSLEVFCGGKGLNQSVALSRAGADTYHAGSVGKVDGKMLVDALEGANVNTDGIYTSDIRSGNALIQVTKEGQNSIILYGGANQVITEQHADQVLDSFLKGDVLLLQNEINLTGYLINKAYEKGMLIAFNPSPFDDRIPELPLDKVSYFILNEIEGSDIAGCSPQDTGKIMNGLKDRYCNARIVLTLGRRGTIYFDGDTEHYHGVYDVPVVDTTAAGDTFTGYFLASLTKGYSSEDIIALASKASSLAVSRKGASASIPTMDEVVKSTITIE